MWEAATELTKSRITRGEPGKQCTTQALFLKRKKGRTRVSAGDEYKTEVVSPILTYEDMEDLQELVRQLRHKGAIVNNSCGIHVHVGAERFTPQTLRNIVNIIASKEDIPLQGA